MQTVGMGEVRTLARRERERFAELLQLVTLPFQFGLGGAFVFRFELVGAEADSAAVCIWHDDLDSSDARLDGKNSKRLL